MPAGIAHEQRAPLLPAVIQVSGERAFRRHSTRQSRLTIPPGVFPLLATTQAEEYYGCAAAAFNHFSNGRKAESHPSNWTCPCLSACLSALQMRYIKVKWIHAHANEPVWLYSELDDDFWETRKVEVFPDGTKGHANHVETHGTTKFSIRAPPIPR